MLRTAVLGALIRRAVSRYILDGRLQYTSEKTVRFRPCGKRRQMQSQRRHHSQYVNAVDCPYQKRMAKALGAMRIATQKASDGGTSGASDLESQLLVHGRSQSEFVLGR